MDSSTLSLTRPSSRVAAAGLWVLLVFVLVMTSAIAAASGRAFAQGKLQVIEGLSITSLTSRPAQELSRSGPVLPEAPNARPVPRSQIGGNPSTVRADYPPIFLESGRILALVRRATLTLWNIRKAEAEQTVTLAKYHREDAVSVSPDGERVIGLRIRKINGGADTSLKVDVWDAHTGNLVISLLSIHTDLHFWISPQRDVLVIARDAAPSPDWLELWSLITGKFIRSLSPSDGETVAFSKDGKRIAAAYPGRRGLERIVIWNMAITRVTGVITQLKNSERGSARASPASHAGAFYRPERDRSGTAGRLIGKRRAVRPAVA